MSSRLSSPRKRATDVISASDENGDAFHSPLVTITIPTLNRTGMSQLSNSSSTYKKGKLSTTESVNRLFSSVQRWMHTIVVTMVTMKCSWKLWLSLRRMLGDNELCSDDGGDVGDDADGDSSSSELELDCSIFMTDYKIHCLFPSHYLLHISDCK
jgi:hypothetical protein